MKSVYQPDSKILERYAQVLVEFALNSGQGLKPDEVVQLNVPDVAKPLALCLQNAVLRAGGHPLLRLLPTGFEADFFKLAQKKQLSFFPAKYSRAKAELIDHQIAIIAEPFPFELKTVDPDKIVLARDSKKQYRDWLVAKETQGDFTWTVALWGVQAKADLVGLSLEDYWQQIIKACFLDESDPIAKWRAVTKLQKQTLAKLNQLKIAQVLVKGHDVNLKVTLGEDRIWQGGGGRNIPSFECFTSPDWRGVEGWIKFNQPLYRYGNKIEGVRLEFSKGLVTSAQAKSGGKLLKAMLKSKNADKAGEFSLTDARLSRISHVMAETLFDENIGGPYGNTHLAIGMAYHDCYRGDQSKLTKKDWLARGFNDSAEHTDIVSTTDRTVEATLTNGVKKIIYARGQFAL